MRNSSNLSIIPGGQDTADQHFIRANLSFRCFVEFHDVLVDLWGDYRSTVFCSVAGKDHHEVAFSLHAQVTSDDIL